MRASKTFSALGFATVVAMIFCCIQSATAGTKGAFVNTSGYGVAVNSVVYNGVTNTAKSASMYNPCSAVNRQANLVCTYGKALPQGTPSTG